MRLSAILAIILFLAGCGHTKLWTQKEKALLFASCLAAGADCYTAERNLDQPNGTELNPIISGKPSDRQLIGYFVTSQGVMIVTCHYQPWIRPYLLPGKTMLNLAGTASNIDAKRKTMVIGE